MVVDKILERVSEYVYNGIHDPDNKTKYLFFLFSMAFLSIWTKALIRYSEHQSVFTVFTLAFRIHSGVSAVTVFKWAKIVLVPSISCLKKSSHIFLCSIVSYSKKQKAILVDFDFDFDNKVISSSFLILEYPVKPWYLASDFSSTTVGIYIYKYKI